MKSASVGRSAVTEVPAANTKSPQPVPTSPPPSYGLDQAEVLYNYTSDDEGDLNIVSGQRITILEYGKSYLDHANHSE